MPVTLRAHRGRTSSPHPTVTPLTLDADSTRELCLLRAFLRHYHGERVWSEDELRNAVDRLTLQVPIIHRLIAGINADDSGTLGDILLAVARTQDIS